MQHIGKDKEPMQILEPALLKSTDGHTSDQAHKEGESAMFPWMKMSLEVWSLRGNHQILFLGQGWDFFNLKEFLLLVYTPREGVMWQGFS